MTMRIATATAVLMAILTASARGQESAEEWFAAARSALEAGDGWAAARSFERAIREGYPAAAGHRALAEAWLATDNRLFQAREAMERALASDPTDVEGWYVLADINLRIDGYDAEMRARAAFREVVRLDPWYRDAWERWSGLYLDVRDLKEMSALLEQNLRETYDPRVALRRIDLLYDAGEFSAAWDAIREFRDHVADPQYMTPISYYEGVVLAALGRNEEGSREYFRGLSLAESAEDVAFYWTDVLPLASAGEQARWKSLPVPEQVEFLQSWWNRRDPLPFGDSNERWVEQMRRIRVARETFRWMKPWAQRAWISLDEEPDDFGLLDGRRLDDRGPLFLRHGEPDFQAGVGRAECGFWYYRREGLPEDGSFALNFGRSMGGNDCVFKQGPTTGMGLQHFSPGVGGSDPLAVLRVRDETRDDLAVGLSSDSYRFEIENRIPLSASAANFSFFRRETDVAVHFAVPLLSVWDETSPARYRKGLVLYDAEWRELARESADMEVAMTRGNVEGPEEELFLVDLFRMRVIPGAYHYALQIDDLRGGGTGIVKGDLDVRDFPPGRLALSDLVLSARIAEDGSDARFQRYGRTIYPLPTGRLAKRQELHMYYEVYHLRSDEEGSARFRVDYSIHGQRLDRNAAQRFLAAVSGLVGVRQDRDSVTLSFERSDPPVAAGVWAEHISFDTGALPAGSYILDVAVTDLSGGGDPVSQAVSFTIVR